MLYIKQERRYEIDELGVSPDNAGELNYLFTTIGLKYLSRKGKKYQILNDICGALEHAKLEFARRMVGPYEDTKIEENGDVYP